MAEPIPLTLAVKECLTLAIGDMRQAAARLLDKQIDVHARRALETAISVCYARPWIASNQSGKLKDRWLPSVGADRNLHDMLLELRRSAYAHSDPAGGRKARLDDGIGEEWIPLRRDLLSSDRRSMRSAERAVHAGTRRRSPSR
jgi:hypothetical protein